MNRRRRAVGAAMLAALVFAGCGSGRAETSAGTVPPAGRAPTSTAHLHHGTHTPTAPTAPPPPTTAGTTVIPTTAPPGPATPPPTDPPTTVPPSPTTTVKPFDPADPIDLSGTPGVTAAQVAEAERLLRSTIRELPRFASRWAAVAAGYRSIGDGITGYEHWVNWAYADDTTVFDARRPESLVYRMRPGREPVLEAAMYMLPTGRVFADVPPLYRSPLTQFHVHTNICFVPTADPLQKLVVGLTDPSGACARGDITPGNVPMLHVWIVPNPCGPFAALEGIGAGQVAPGESHTCDTLHGGH